MALITKRNLKLNGKLVTAEEHSLILVDAFKQVIKIVNDTACGFNAAIKQVPVINHESFYKVIDSDPQYLEMYARATKDRADAIAERIMEVSHNSKGDWYINEKGCKVPNPVAVQRDRLRMEADRWLAGKLNPRKYSDKVNIDANINVMNPLTTTEAEEILKEIE